MGPGHAHGSQQAEFSGAFEDRQRQGVGYAHQGDDDGQGQQHVDQRQQLIDRLGLLRFVAALVEDLGTGVAVDDLLDGGQGGGVAGPGAF